MSRDREAERALALYRRALDGESIDHELDALAPEDAKIVSSMLSLAESSGRSHEAALSARSRLGPYRIERLLGRGGQAWVYRAIDTRDGQPVALKILRNARVDSPGRADRFRAEARLIARVDHPCVCRLLDFGTADGEAYIAMAFIDGESVADVIARLRSGGPPPDPLACVAAIESAARGLHTAHAIGIIHRDVKPANLMRTADGRVVLLDFGLARLDDGTASATATGHTAGTPTYMSPEQIEGDPTALDARTDVYSLACTLFEWIYLRPPFEAANRQQLFHAILADEPTFAATDAPVPPALITVLRAALEKRPARRYDTALAFADDLARVRAGQPVRARRRGPIGRLVRWAERRPLQVWATGGSIAAALVITALGAYLLQHQGDIARGTAVSRQSAVDDELDRGYAALRHAPALAVGAFDRALEMAPANPEVVVARAMALLEYGEAGRAVALLDETTADVPAGAATPLRALARRDRASATNAPAPETELELFAAGWVAARAADDDFLGARSATPLLRRALLATERPRSWLFAEALRAASRAGDEALVAELAAAATERFAGRAWIHAEAGLALYAVGRFDAGIAALDRAAACEPNNGRWPRLAKDNRIDLAERSIAALDIEKARAIYDVVAAQYPDDTYVHSGRVKAMKMSAGHRPAIRLSRTLNERYPDRPQLIAQLASLLSEVKQRDEALALYDRALAIDPTHRRALNGRAITLSWLGRLDDAIDAFRAVARRYPESGTAHFNLAQNLATAGRHRQAVNAARRALELDPSFWEPGHTLAKSLDHLSEHDAAWAARLDLIDRFRRSLDRPKTFARPAHIVDWIVDAENTVLRRVEAAGRDAASSTDPTTRATHLAPCRTGLSTVLARWEREIYAKTRRARRVAPSVVRLRRRAIVRALLEENPLAWFPTEARDEWRMLRSRYATLVERVERRE